MKVLLDSMLGTLATYLRMCGYDAAYAPDRGVEADGDVRSLAEVEGRTLITRDASLAADTDGVLIESLDVGDQLRELDEAGFDLSLDDPSRCGRCNGRLEEIDTGETTETPEYAPDPADRRVWRCTECGQCFWKGSHWDRVARTLAEL